MGVQKRDILVLSLTFMFHFQSRTGERVRLLCQDSTKTTKQLSRVGCKHFVTQWSQKQSVVTEIRILSHPVLALSYQTIISHQVNVD